MARTRSQPRTSALPWGTLPRLLSRPEAAAYCNIGTTTFDKAVNEGLLPRPLRIYTRVLWDRVRLDTAIEALADTDSTAHVWRDVA
jgi:predicted DNA-binding transcriptional regulator AlpA